MEINTNIQCHSNSIYVALGVTCYNCLDNHAICKTQCHQLKQYGTTKRGVNHAIKRSGRLQVVNRKDNNLLLCPGHFMCMEVLEGRGDVSSNKAIVCLARFPFLRWTLLGSCIDMAIREPPFTISKDTIFPAPIDNRLKVAEDCQR